ncbi:ran-binding protein 9 isoform X2 [Culicoides brevitarsis]|uniref:ran-binding protein 9 isoform X2 n=1 Tax=Culicoides brevitarsis TaxID=469753 RepID=UPI00307B4036
MEKLEYQDSPKSDATLQQVDRLKLLYPNVNEDETPLPRNWSPTDKCNSIYVHNFRVHYKGIGKSHNDAASVRTAHPVPAACGLYYFEVKIISKGRDGYMGIGLTAQNFKANRLPGWDKGSYGYHGDDGNSFCSSGNGQPYGPTFTTNDIIGCGVNLVDNTCFYTKNGHHLGIAFRDLPTKLYPTVGLQTPGEIVDANFGQEPFKFDIEDMLKELRASTKASIYNFPVPDDQGDWTTILHRMVSSYLVHHGFSSTAEAFAKSTGQTFNEDLASIKTRQKILKLVLSGRMGQAIEQTIRFYPGLLESNQNLLFMLKCRQFVEMVNGCDFDNDSQVPSSRESPITQAQSVIQSTKTYHNGTTTQNNSNLVISDPSNSNDNQDPQSFKNNNLSHHHDLDENNKNVNNGNSGNHDIINIQELNQINSQNSEQYLAVAGMDNTNGSNSDVEMENGHTNGFKNGNSNNIHDICDGDEEMDVDGSPGCIKSSSNKSGVERMLEFGRELFQMSQRLEKENGVNETNQKTLEDAFSLLAYSNPWASPLGWQLCPSRRETICAALNSAILESMNYSWRPPLEISIAHASELLRLMSNSNLGACAFVTVDDMLHEEVTPHN